MTAQDQQPRPIVYDSATGRVGEVMDRISAQPGGPVTSVWLRPVGGGYEWRTDPGNVQPYQPKTTSD